MVNVLSYILFALAVITALLGLFLHYREDKNTLENRIFFYLSLSSSFWSFCWSMLVAQTNTHYAYIWRCIGVAGIVAYLILATIIVLIWGDIKGRFRIYAISFSLLGILIYPFHIQKNVIHFHTKWFGMSYEFLPSFGTYIYSTYAVIIALNIAAILIYMRKKSARKYQKVLAYKVIICEFVLVFGMLFDTIIPLFRFGAFPGSAIGQAVSVILMYSVILFSNRSRITFTNLSEYISYSTESPIIIVDEVGNLKFANDSALKFFDISEEKLISIHINQLFDIKPISLPLKKQIMKLEMECLYNHAYCDVQFSTILDDYGDLLGFIVTITDLTDKQHMIQQLTEERNRADQANEAKSSFLAKMSHEIRTPINAILGMDELLLRETENPTLRKYALNIQSASRSLLSIVNNILDFSKIESGKMELVEDTYKVGNLILDLKNVLSIKAEDKGLALNINLAKDTPCALYGDEVRIRQILTNLLNNAIKYTDKGHINLDVAWEPIVIDEIKHAQLIINVQDTGIGIKKEDLDKLFTVFQRLDIQRNHTIEGTGLGLSIVKRFTELMNGTIAVKSEYEKGSVFTFTLTQKIMDETPVGDFNQITSSDIRNEVIQKRRTAPRARVLIVDDNRVNIAVLKGLLKRTLVQVDTVLSGAACLEKVQNNRYDVIYLDHMMPEMDGIETLAAIQQLENNQSKEAFIIALTANAILGAKEMYLSHGFHDYLSKPIDSEQLETMLFEHLPQELIEY